MPTLDTPITNMITCLQYYDSFHQNYTLREEKIRVVSIISEQTLYIMIFQSVALQFYLECFKKIRQVMV